MNRFTESLKKNRFAIWLTKKPLGQATLAAVFGLAQAYEAAYLDNPNGLWSVFSWICAAVCVICCAIFILEAISDHFSKVDD